MPGFETERLRMLPLEAADETLFVGLYTDAETMRFIGPAMSTAHALRFFRRCAKQPRPVAGPHIFVCREKATGDIAGICGTMSVDLRRMLAEVGVMLKSDVRARGFGRECLQGIVRNTFDSYPVDRIWVVCSALNPVVERLTVRAGFVPD